MWFCKSCSDLHNDYQKCEGNVMTAPKDLGQPAEPDPQLNQIFGMTGEDFRENDRLRVETERQIIAEDSNRFRVVVGVRNAMNEALEDGLSEDVVEVLDMIKEWRDELDSTLNGH